MKQVDKTDIIAYTNQWILVERNKHFTVLYNYGLVRFSSIMKRSTFVKENES